MDRCSQRLPEFQQGSVIETIPGCKTLVRLKLDKKSGPTLRKKGIAITSRPLRSIRSLASGVGCGAVTVVYTAQRMDMENGMRRRDMVRCYPALGQIFEYASAPIKVF